MCLRSACSQRRGFGRLGRREGLPQEYQVDIGHREIQHEHVKPRNTDSHCGGRRIRCHCRAVAGRPQQCQQLLGASGIAFEDEDVKGRHGVEVRRMEKGKGERGHAVSLNPKTERPPSRG